MIRGWASLVYDDCFNDLHVTYDVSRDVRDSPITRVVSERVTIACGSPFCNH